MPEDKITSADLEMYVLKLEQMDSDWLRCKDYEVVQKVLESGETNIDISLIERLLVICEQALKEDMKFTPNILKVISAIVAKVKGGEYTPLPNLVPSAVAIIQIIKTAALLSKVETLKALCFETLLSYPNTTLITVATSHCIEVIEIFNLYGHPRITLENRVQTCNLIYKLLKILPSDKRPDFVKAGVSAWFSKTIPTVMTYLSDPKAENIRPLLTLELLTEELVLLEYSDHPQWLIILECICNTKKYPSIMKNLLEKGSNIWHRIWIIFIKLLKNQITRSSYDIGSPINSMLLIVETAFKMDKTNRCRAFTCWNVLIDNFCNETNENYLTKRVKLLIVPLKSNNAKVEEIALAKFDSWWHLIFRFQHKMDKYIGPILVPFLQFCFGNPNESDANAFVPGKLSEALKKKCRQALIEICGHDVDCDKCPSLPRLNGRVFTSHSFDQFVYVVHSFVTAIKLSTSTINDEETAQQIKCLCESFLNIVGDLPSSNQKTRIVTEILQGIENCLRFGNHLTEILFDIIIPSLFNEEHLYKTVLLVNDDDHCRLLHDLVIIIVKQELMSFFVRFNTQEFLTKCKPIANAIVMESLNFTNLIKSTLKDMPSNIKSFAMWTALAESILECQVDFPINISDLLAWPLEHMNQYSDIQISAMVWYKLYIQNPKSIDAEENILNIINCNGSNDSKKVLTLYATIAILKRGLINETCDKYIKEVELLETLVKKIDDFEHNVQVFPILIDILVIMMENASKSTNLTLAQHTIYSVKHVLKLMPRVLTKESALSHQILVGNLLKSMDTLLKIESYFKYFPIISDDLAEYLTLFSKHATLKKIISSIMKTVSKSKNVVKPENDLVDIDGDESIKKTALPAVTNQDSVKINFPTPNTKTIKKSKKKEASIVNTVVENGEEYVVVKSNWKFNPKNLTENQKEKLQRKREDIPALYQDLSQSQDEFRLSSWKTDSQDASSTNSKSNMSSSNQSSSILKNILCTDVVPQIMDSLISEKDKQAIREKDILPKEIPENGLKDIVYKVKKLASPLNNKSPRMALKDRVFRNVRNLIENQALSKDNKTSTMNPIQNDNVPKTPSSNPKIDNNIINSAPPLLSENRPSRVKRKPRKFDDTEILASKSARRSLSQSDIQHDSNMSGNESRPVITDDIETKQNNIENDKCLPTAKITDNVITEDVGVTTENENNEAVSCGVAITSELPTVFQEDLTQDIDNEIPLKDDMNHDKNDTPELNSNLPVAQTIELPESDTVQNVCKENNELSTPTPSSNNKKNNCDKLSTKKVRKSRIEKELAIDMVEGHPFLKIQSEKRVTRKKLISSETRLRRKSLSDKFIKAMSDTDKNEGKMGKTPKVKALSCSKKDTTTTIVTETEEIDSTPSTDLPTSEESPFSEDIIESSQDSTLPTMSVRSTKKTLKKIPVVSIAKMKDHHIKSIQPIKETQKVSDNEETEIVLSESLSGNQLNKDDIEISRNKTALAEKTVLDLTENMDTEPIENTDDSDIILIDNDESPITINTEENNIGPDTQELAEADTQPTNSIDVLEDKLPESTNTKDTDIELSIQSSVIEISSENVSPIEERDTMEVSMEIEKDMEVHIDTDKDITMTAVEPNEESSAIDIGKNNNSETSSPYKDDAQRKKDFLNNTLEISPIKILSPDREKKSPSPESSSDYVVIKLSSPVHINGEPFENKGSPEVFTDDKVSPDKRDQSPPRVEFSVNSTSPSSSLSLKKNRPQVRPGGRAAQMLGLCVPDRLQTIRTDRTEPEDPKKSSPSNTPARRNLKILYNTANKDNENVNENDMSENFLSFKRLIPSVDSSPSVPILKRKLAEIVDDATASPANKRKRVSFQDPPVSTTVAVQKYIEANSLKSPQNASLKRLERQARSNTNNMKSQRRLDTAFKLDSVLTKAVESFTDIDPIITPSVDDEASSLEQTPAVEVIKTSELNDSDPICALLLDCKDPIDNIAAELSSPAMKLLLVKELEGNIETIGDLAKMTELEVNRLCIKAPKVQVAKKVLADYASKIMHAIDDQEMENVDEPVSLCKEDTVPEINVNNVEVQTNEIVIKDVEIQVTVSEKQSTTQTEVVPTLHCHAQTDESGSKSTADIITSCLTERHDFIEKLSDQLDGSSIQQLSEKLPVNTLTDILIKKMTASDSTQVLNRVLEQNREVDGEQNKQLVFLRDYLLDKFDSKDWILLCSQLLQKHHDQL